MRGMQPIHSLVLSLSGSRMSSNSSTSPSPPTPSHPRAGASASAPKESGPVQGDAAPCLVVGYDGSPEARHAAAWAARRAAPDGMLVLVHASRPRRLWLPSAILATAFERRDRGRALLDELFMDGDEALLKVRVETKVVDDDPAHALIEAAHNHGAREIVVGSHHRSRLDPVYGDIAAELVRTAPVPVSVVPLEGEPSTPSAD
jgi:nucleotide-binding universal stress UspA family protein